jgi:hypothetical protein
MIKYISLVSTLVVLCLIAPIAGWGQAAAAGSAPTTVALPAQNSQPHLGDVPMMGAKGNNRVGQVFRGTGNSHWAAAPPTDTATPTLIMFGAPEQKKIDELSEDLKILSYLLSRSLERAFASVAPEYKLGIPMLATSEGHAVQATYVAGYGVLLTLRVRFPVVAPSETEKTAEAAEPGSEWDEAARAVKEGRGEDSMRPRVGHPFAFSSEEAAVYDARLVDTLKRRILAILKNASNVRNLKPDDWFIVSVTGPANGANSEEMSFGGMGGGGGFGGVYAPKERAAVILTKPSSKRTLNQPAPVTPPPPPDTLGNDEDSNESPASPDSNRPTLMTIRVKKSSVDAFAAGKTSKEQFAKDAEVGTYLGGPSRGGGHKDVMLWRSENLVPTAPQRR